MKGGPRPGSSALAREQLLFLLRQRPLGDRDLEYRPLDFFAAPAVILNVVDEALVSEPGALVVVPLAGVLHGNHPVRRRELDPGLLRDAQVPAPVFVVR